MTSSSRTASSAPVVAREYLRVSKDAHHDARSTSEQHDELVAAVEAQGWSLSPLPAYEDVDVSASRYARSGRPDFTRLLADLGSGAFGADVLALWELSRGSRRTSEWLALIDACQAASVRIWVNTHGRVYDPSNARDRRTLREDASDAEYESDKTSERLRRSAAAGARAGRPYGRAPYGYRRVYDERTRELVRVEEDPVTGPVVREILERLLRGESMYRVAQSLNERGVPQRTPARKSRNADQGWTGAAVKQVATLPAYAAYRSHLGELHETDWWPALISRDDWHRLQAMVSPEARRRPGQMPAVHLLSGLAVCDECGAPLRVRKQNSGRYRKKDGTLPPRHVGPDGSPLPRPHYYSYMCVGRSGVGGDRWHVAMREEHLDAIVSELVIARLSRPDVLSVLARHDGDADEERARVQAELDADRAFLEQAEATSMERRDPAYYYRVKDQVQPRIDAAQERLNALVDADPSVLALAGADDVRGAWEALDIADKRTVIGALLRPRVKRAATRGARGIDPSRVSVEWLSGL